MVLMLLLSSNVTAQNQQLTAKQLSEKADEALSKENYKEALKWIRLAAEKGDPSSQELLSTLLEGGDAEFGVEKDETEAIKWLIKAAEAGETSAQMGLARHYLKGKIVAQNDMEAIRWYEKAAKKNDYALVCLKEIYEQRNSQEDAEALYKLGQLFLNKKANQEGEKCFLLAAEKGNVSAMNSLGVLLAGKKEYSEAVKWYRLAADKGNATAMNNLAYNYEKGNGVTKDLNEAEKWYRMAAEKGDDNGLWRFYRNHIKDMEALDYYKKQAEKGDAKAMVRIAKIYENYQPDLKSIQDYREVLRWYTKASEAGSHVASRRIGDMYQIGLYVKQDYEEAKKWYAKADKQAKESVSTTLGVSDGHEYVDLGLSVKWATCNLGASKPHEYGNYYAWGETTPKKTYTFSSYKFYKDKNGNGTAFNKKMDVEPGEFVSIGKDISGTQYDAARAKWGGKWRMPTKDEWQELIDHTSYQWINEGQVVGLKLTGPNGNSIFFPACGFYREGKVYMSVTDGQYWSSTAEGEKAYELYITVVMEGFQRQFDGEVGGWGNPKEDDHRQFGYCIRPVIDK
jgi:TPR repeat protein